MRPYPRSISAFVATVVPCTTRSGRPPAASAATTASAPSSIAGGVDGSFRRATT